MTRIKVAAALVLLAASTAAISSDGKMTFFVTSHGIGNGGNLGGIEGGDAHCAIMVAVTRPGS